MFEEKAWILYAACSCLSFGLANFISGVLANTNPIPTTFLLTSFGFIPMWIVFKIFEPPSEVKIYSDLRAFKGIVVRAINAMSITVGIFLAFYLATLSGLNLGVIASVMTLAIFFTSIFFLYFYDEKLGLSDILGAVCVMAGVCLISFFGGGGAEIIDELGAVAPASNSLLQFAAIGVGLLCAVCVAWQSLICRHYTQTIGFTTLQFNVEGYFLVSIVFMVAIIIQTLCMGYFPYTMIDIFWGALFAACTMAGAISITLAFQQGQGGAVQAIDSLKVVVTLVLDMVVYHSTLSTVQLLGVSMCILGAFVIVYLQKPSKAVQEEETSDRFMRAEV